MTDGDSIQKLQQAIEERFGGISVLVNNAGIYPDEGRSVLEVELETFQSAMETDFYGPLLLCQDRVLGMISRDYGRVVNVSSGLGQLSTKGNDAPAYAASKAALNALTRMVADAARSQRLGERGGSGLGTYPHGWAGCVSLRRTGDRYHRLAGYIARWGSH